MYNITYREKHNVLLGSLKKCEIFCSFRAMTILPTKYLNWPVFSSAGQANMLTVCNHSTDVCVLAPVAQIITAACTHLQSCLEIQTPTSDKSPGHFPSQNSSKHSSVKPPKKFHQTNPPDIALLKKSPLDVYVIHLNNSPKIPAEHYIP